MKLNFTNILEASKKRVEASTFPVWLSAMCVDSVDAYDTEVIALAAFEEGRLQVLDQMRDAQMMVRADGSWEAGYGSSSPVCGSSSDSIVDYLDSQQLHAKEQ